MTACGTEVVMAEYFSAKWSGYNDKTEKTYILEYRFQNNQLPIVKNNLLLLKKLSVASFN